VVDNETARLAGFALCNGIGNLPCLVTGSGPAGDDEIE